MEGKGNGKGREMRNGKGNEKWEMGNGKGNGKWEMGNGKWEMGNGKGNRKCEGKWYRTRNISTVTSSD